jgi:hypothetical protein
MTQAVRCAVGPWGMNRFRTWASGRRMAIAGSLASDVRGVVTASEGTCIRVAHASYDQTVDWASQASGEYRACCAASQLP